METIFGRVTSFLVLGAVACSGGAAGDVSGADGGGDVATPLPTHLMVTADFANRSLSVIDYDRLLMTADRDESLWGTIDLSAFAPGPLEVELTPDGATAIVAVAPGFFDQLGGIFGFAPVSAGGTVLLVDLQTRSVRATIATASAPMGIAVSPDGKRAFTANYGVNGARGETLSIIDIEAGTLLDEVEVGPGPEQVSLSTDGSRGIINTAGDGSVRVFDPSDPRATLSEPLRTSGDPSDVAFVGTTGRVVVANSQSDTGYSVVDASVPNKLALTESVKLSGGIPYAATHIPGTSEVLVSVTGTPARLIRVDVSETPAKQEGILLTNEMQTFPLGVAVTPDGEHAFVGLPVYNAVTMVSLDTGDVVPVPWLSEDGPTYVALVLRD